MKRCLKKLVVFAIVVVNLFSVQAIYADDKPKQKKETTEKKERDIRDDIEILGIAQGKR